MRRDVTTLRNIGIVTTIDAGNAPWRESIFELMLGAREASDSAMVHPRSLAPATVLPARR